MKAFHFTAYPNHLEEITYKNVVINDRGGNKIIDRSLLHAGFQAGMDRVGAIRRPLSVRTQFVAAVQSVAQRRRFSCVML